MGQAALFIFAKEIVVNDQMNLQFVVIERPAVEEVKPAREWFNAALVKSDPANALPRIPVVVSLARIAGCPIRRYKVVDIATPERWRWVEYWPHGMPHPWLPVPVVNFGKEMFGQLRLWADHYHKWRFDLPLTNQKVWSANGYALLNRLTSYFDQFPVLTPHERVWLPAALWQQWATPGMSPEEFEV